MAGQVTDRISLFIAHWMGRVDARSGRNTKSADPDAVDSSDGSRWRLECGFPPVKIDPMPNQPSTPTQAVAVVGGGVAGSEIASKMAENGILVAVFERDRVAFGEPDGAVPFWHEERRRAERDTIVAKLSHPGIEYIPCTAVGKELDFRDLVGPKWNFTAVVLANGAALDRELELPSGPSGREFLGRGFEYRRSFVRSFNESHRAGSGGPRIEDNRGGGVVIGGGLAALDVAKIMNLEAVITALSSSGIEVDMARLELDGIEKTLEKFGLNWEDLGIEPARVFYRGRIADMSVLPFPRGADHLRRAKVEATRTRLVAQVRAKFGIEVVPLSTPDSLVIEADRVVGVRMRKTVIASGAMVRTGETFEVSTSQVVAAIGSVPEDIPGIPRGSVGDSDGESYRLNPKDRFALDGFPKVFVLGSVLSGKGSFTAARDNAQRVSKASIESYLGIVDLDNTEREAETQSPTQDAPANEVMRRTHICTHHSPEAMLKLRGQIKQRQVEVGYEGVLRDWL